MKSFIQYIKDISLDEALVVAEGKYVPEIHEARDDYKITIEGGRGKGKKFMHKDTSTDDHLSAMEFHLKGYHVAKKSKLEATKNHHATMYHKHKDQIEALGDVGNHLKESNAHKILAKKLQQIAIAEGAMPASVYKHKQAMAEKTPEQMHQGFKEVAGRQNKSVEHVARSMAWSHGYGKMSGHYWNQVKHLEPQ